MNCITAQEKCSTTSKHGQGVGKCLLFHMTSRDPFSRKAVMLCHCSWAKSLREQNPSPRRRQGVNGEQLELLVPWERWARGQMEYQRAPLPQHRCGMTCSENRFSPACATVLIALTSFHQFSALLITKERICFYVKAESLLLPSTESHFQDLLIQSLSLSMLCQASMYVRKSCVTSLQ